MPTIGLTGNFGMGKTTVLALFRKSGAYTFNIDKFVKEILQEPETIKKIAHSLGKNVLIKSPTKLSINKARVAKIIFNDSDKRKTLEKIIHPQVLKIIKATRSEILKKNPSALIIFEIPLLFEAGYEKYFDKIIVVCCNMNNAISRLVKKGFSLDEAYKRLRAQMPITKKKKLADFVITNNYDIENTGKQVRRIFENLKQLRSR
ncbi:MAG: dephospho-CoA kinase [Nitrospirae bacterium]|nr:dephospho-CoA kinase [Nitrospirota bacterium]